MLGCRLSAAVPPRSIPITGIGDHVAPERTITFHRNPQSRSTGTRNPLAGQTLTVVRRTRYAGEPQLVIERVDGGRQLLPMRCVAPESTEPSTTSPALIFTPGSLRALADLVSSLAGALRQTPEGCHASPPRPAAAMDELRSGDAPTTDRPLGRPAAAAAAGASARARKPVP